MNRRYFLIGSVAALTGCVSNQSTAPVGPTATSQQRLATAAGINFAKARALAESKRFDDASDVGFMATAAARGGALGITGGVVSFFAAEPLDRSLMTLLIAETATAKPSPTQKASVLRSIASVTGAKPEDIGVSWGKQGTTDGKQVHIVSFGIRGRSIRTEELIDLHKKIANQHRAFISVYVPPLRYPAGWQNPYLIRAGKKLPL